MNKVIIGFDFSKEEFNVCALCAGVFVEEWYKGKSDVYDLLLWAEQLCEKYDVEGALFCGNEDEAHRKVADYIYGNGHDLWFVSQPNVTDVKEFAKYAFKHYGKRKLYRSASNAITELHEFDSNRRFYMNLKNMNFKYEEEHLQREDSSVTANIKKELQKINAKFDGVISECDQNIQQILDSDDELPENFLIVNKPEN